MYTDVHLNLVAIVLGLFIFFTRLPGVLFPEPFRKFWLAVPRSQTAGYILIGLGIAWCAAAIYMTGFMDITEWQNARGFGEVVRFALELLQKGRLSVWLVFGCIYFLVILLLDDFLAVRGIALLLLLVARVILDAAFVVETPARLVMTVTAYIMVAAGIWFTIAPHRFRDLLGFFLANNQRCRWGCAVGTAFGVLLVALGIWVY